MIQAASRSQFNQRQSDRKVRHTGKAALILLSRNCTEHVSQHKVSPKIVRGPWNLWQYGFLILRHSTSLGFSSEIVLADPQGTQGLSVNCHTGRYCNSRNASREWRVPARSSQLLFFLLCGFKFLVPFHTDPNIYMPRFGLKLWLWNHQSAMIFFAEATVSLWTQGLQRGRIFSKSF